MLKRLLCIVYFISRMCTRASVPACVCAPARVPVCVRIAGIIIEKRVFLHFTTINQYLTTHFMLFYAFRNQKPAFHLHIRIILFFALVFHSIFAVLNTTRE